MDKKLNVGGRDFEVMIPESEIVSAVERVAARLNADYCDADRVLLLGVLNGSFIFMSDLVRHLDFQVEMSFVKISSYEGESSTGCVRELIGLNESIEGRNVVVVEDIVDTGCSIDHMLELLRSKGVLSAKVCTLFFKPNAYRGVSTVDYAAMEIGNEFIIGYGLDFDGAGRQYKDIYVTR